MDSDDALATMYDLLLTNSAELASIRQMLGEIVEKLDVRGLHIA